jgi:hypothetical protein
VPTGWRFLDKAITPTHAMAAIAIEHAQMKRGLFLNGLEYTSV